jgi:hypothetical protein
MASVKTISSCRYALFIGLTFAGSCQFAAFRHATGGEGDVQWYEHEGNGRNGAGLPPLLGRRAAIPRAKARDGDDAVVVPPARASRRTTCSASTCLPTSPCARWTRPPCGTPRSAAPRAAPSTRSRFTAARDEQTLTWSNQPATTGPPASVVAGAGGGDLPWDLTDLVTDAEHEFLIRNRTATGESDDGRRVPLRPMGRSSSRPTSPVSRSGARFIAPAWTPCTSPVTEHRARRRRSPVRHGGCDGTRASVQ